MEAVMRPPQIHNTPSSGGGGGGASIGDNDDGSISKNSHQGSKQSDVVTTTTADNSVIASDLMPGGFHMPVSSQDNAIIAADTSYQRCMLITIGSDRTARLWNTVTHKCVFIHDLRSDSPTVVSLHHTGNTALIAFKDKIRAYNVLVDKLK